MKLKKKSQKKRKKKKKQKSLQKKQLRKSILLNGVKKLLMLFIWVCWNAICSLRATPRAITW